MSAAVNLNTRVNTVGTAWLAAWWLALVSSRGGVTPGYVVVDCARQQLRSSCCTSPLFDACDCSNTSISVVVVVVVDGASILRFVAVLSLCKNNNSLDVT